jgi:hypothetical protein
MYKPAFGAKSKPMVGCNGLQNRPFFVEKATSRFGQRTAG